MEITFKQLVNKLKIITGLNITYDELARILGVKSSTINQRITRKTKAKRQDILTLKQYYGIGSNIDIAGEVEEVPYIYINYYLTPFIKDVWKDREFKPLILDKYGVATEWGVDFKNLRLIPMLGDKMESTPNDHLNIRNNDILIMDISSRDLRRSGIYAYETLGGNKLQISNVNIMVDGRYRFYYANKNYLDEIRTEEDLKALQFKVVGRIIKNMSFVHK